MNSSIKIRKIGYIDEEMVKLKRFLNAIDNIFYVPLSESTNIDEYAEKILKNGLVIIAEIEGEVIGAILGYANNLRNKNAYISSFGILEEYRSHGIGKEILNKFKENCKNYGMEKIEVYTHYTNESANRFYKKNGFIREVDPNNKSDELYLICNLFIDKDIVIKDKKILVTAIGSFSADIVLKILKEYEFDIIGCDIYPSSWIAEAENVNHFYQAPYVENREEYIKFIEKICIIHDVKYIFPLTDPEVDLLSGEKKRLLKKGIIVCVSQEQIIKICRDKYNLPKYLTKQGIRNVIPTVLLSEDNNFNYPLFVKPRSGRSSEGCIKLANLKDYTNIIDSLEGEDYIVQPFIEGNILTVDVVRDPLSDEVVCIARRELLRNKAGAGTTVEIIEEPKLEELCISIAKEVSIIGAVNFEFIETSRKEYYFLEINPRFSGGVEFSHMAGYDVIGNHLNCFRSKEIAKNIKVKKIIIARKYEEYITKVIDI